MNSDTVHPSFYTKTRIMREIALTAFAIEGPLLERKLFSSLADAVYVLWTNHIPVTLVCMTKVYWENDDHLTVFDMHDGFLARSRYPVIDSRGNDSVLHMPARDIADLRSALYNYSRGHTGIMEDVVGWTPVDLSHWETNNPIHPGVLEAIFEAWVHFASSFKYHSSYMKGKSYHFRLTPRTFHEWKETREQYEKRWPYFRASVIRYLVTHGDTSDLGSVVPDLRR